jgi:hypothetical protein
MAIDFSNMGVALGAGVDEWHRQQAEARAQQRAEQEQEQFGWQRRQYEQQRQQYEQQQALRAKKQAALDAFNAHQEYAAELDNIPDDKLGDYVQRGITQYNTNPYFKNGFFAKLTTVNGQPVVVHEDGVTRKAEHLPLSRDMIRQGLGVMDGMLRRHLTSMTPEDYLAESDRQDARGLKIRELGVHERNAATNEAYRKDQIDARREEIERRKNEVTYQQDGPGQIYALRDGKVVGVIGRPRPIQGGGGGGDGAGSWAPLGTDADGVPVMMDRKTMGLRRLDGAPIQDVKSLYRKMTGEGQRADPEMNKQILAAKIMLGPEPAVKEHWYGDDDTAKNNWAAQQKYLDSLLGGAAGGAPVDEQRKSLFGSAPPTGGNARPSTADTLRAAAQQRDAGFAASRRHVGDAQDRAGAAEVARLRAALGTNGLRTSLRDQEAEDLRRLLAANQR